MASYLLLRDNKQKGPYTFDQLVSLGLKAYDLVWVEGRSAAWRYPSELAELKPYAPVVEEQPFDRFYKKEEVEATCNLQNIQTKNNKGIEKNESATILPLEQTPSERKIFVSLPGAGARKKQAAEAPLKTEPVMQQQPVSEKKFRSTPVEDEIPEERKDYYSYSQHLHEKNDYAEAEDKVVRLEKRFSQPLDEIKEMYVQTLVDRKRKIARKKTWVGVARKASVPALILIAGVMIGVFFNGFSFGKSHVADNNSSLPVQTQESLQKQGQENYNLSVTPDPNEFVPTNDEQKDDPENINAVKKMENEPSHQENKQETALKSHSGAEKPSEEIISEPEPYQGTKTVNGERQKAVRSNNERSEPATTHTGIPSGEVRNNVEDKIRKEVTVKTNNYKRGSFGGIFDLKLTVSNASRYELDEVIVELQYLKPSAQPLKTEKIKFTSIAPNESSTISIPASSRGIKVAYHITNIKYRDAGDATALHD